MLRPARTALFRIVLIAFAGCTSINDVPDPLRATAICVAETLRTTPNVENVGLVVRSLSDGQPSVLVRYNFHSAPWRHPSVGYLFWNPGSGTVWGGFQGGPDTWELTRAITSMIQRECNTGPIGFA